MHLLEISRRKQVILANSAICQLAFYHRLDWLLNDKTLHDKHLITHFTLWVVKGGGGGYGLATW